MKLKFLELENVGLYRHLRVDFQDGLIGIFGPQGSGKSTLVNAGYAALTNDYSRFINGKTGAICQQAEAHEAAKIVLGAEHGGEDFTITRILQPTSKHRFEHPGLAKPLIKDGEIAAELAKILGGSRHMLSNYVFVQQWGLRDLFSLTLGDRAKTLSHLCGTTLAEVCWELVGKQIEKDRSLAAEVVDNSDEIRQQIGTTQTNRNAAMAAAALAKLSVLDTASKAKFEKQIRDHEEREAKETELAEKIEEEATLLQTAKDAVKDHKVKDAAVTAAEQVKETAKAAYQAASAKGQEYLSKKRQWDQYETKRKAHVQATEDLSALIKPPMTVIEKLTELDDEIATLARKMSPFESIIADFSELEAGAAVCPTCKQPVTDVLAQLEAAKTSLTPLASRKAELTTKRARRSSYDMLLQTYQAARTRLADRLAELMSDMSACEVKDEPQPVTGAAELGAASTKADNAWEAAKRVLNTAVTAKATAIANHKACKAQLETLQTQLLETTVTDNELVAARQALEKHVAALVEKVRNETLLEQYDKYLQEKRAELETIQHLLSRGDKARVWLSRLEQVRSVLHRDALPRVVHEAALRRMENGINATLEEFEAPWYVKTSAEDLSYVAHFVNGTVMPAQGLSGGQQVVLSLALRWTLHSLFAGQIGTMVLDEPTAGLDQRHIELLETALAGLGRAAKSRGAQVIIITHERRLEGVFNQVIELEKVVA